MAIIDAMAQRELRKFRLSVPTAGVSGELIDGAPASYPHELRELRLTPPGAS